MKLARFTTGTHNSGCSGCPACSEQAARSMLEATTARDPGGVPPPPDMFEALKAAAQASTPHAVQGGIAKVRAARETPPPTLKIAAPASPTSTSALRTGSSEPAPAPPDMFAALKAKQADDRARGRL